MQVTQDINVEFVCTCLLQVFSCKRVWAIEAELSDWLSEKTSHGDERRQAEQLFDNYEQVTVIVHAGKFTKLRGPEAQISRLEEVLTKTYVSRAAAGSGVESGAEQPRDPRDSRDPHNPPCDPLLDCGDPRDQFVDEMDVEEHTWHYLLFRHANLLSDFASKYNCGVGLKHSLDSRGQVQSRVRVNTPSKACLETASEEMVSLLQVLMEQDIQGCQVNLGWNEYFGELEEELRKKDILLLSSPCYVVGPAGR